MVSVQEVREIISNNCPTSRWEQLPLERAAGYVLAEDVRSLVDSPPFHQSAMDGYAFAFGDWNRGNGLKVVDESRAGGVAAVITAPKEAIRIFTGAVLPERTDTVVMQEKVVRNGNFIEINDDELSIGKNVRQKASQCRKNEIILFPGTLLTPAAISFLAGSGVEYVHVYSKPVVSIIATGSELVKPGKLLSEGKIYESNTYGLTAALGQLGVSPVTVQVVPDDERAIVEAVASQYDADFILLTAGVSVGEYDFVTTALEKCGVRKLFYKVKQKPGKPLFCGKRKDTLFFGLPGNPASALTAFYEYVAGTILSFSHRPQLPQGDFPLAADYSKKAGLTYFLKGKIVSEGVAILPDQESYKMNSFALADCLIELEEEKEYFQKGEQVEVRIII